MDFLAIASMGSFPTPTPTDAERASFAVTYGLFAGPLTAIVVTYLVLVELIKVQLNAVELTLIEHETYFA